MKTIVLIFSMLFSMTLHAQQSNYHFSYTESTSLSKDKIWQVWTDVPNWQEWDKGLKEASLEGAFVAGAKGKLVPDKGPKSKFIISELIPRQSYTLKTKIPFGWLIVKRNLEVENGITYFTHTIEFTGLLKKLFGRLMGKKYRAMLPKVLYKIKEIAENK